MVLSPKNKKRLRDNAGLIQSNKSGISEDFVARCYQIGGKDFVDAIARYGCNERGDKIAFSPWLKEYAELVGDFRIAETLTSGCAQVGKSLVHTNLVCYCLTNGINTLWSYDQERSLNIQVPSNFRPVIAGWLKALNKKPLQQDSKNNTLYQCYGTSSQFVYVSTSKIKESQGAAAAGGIAVGVSRDILFKEERSQYPPGAADPLNRRLDAGRLPSRPVRELGTPGSGNGIEAEIATADYVFYPYYDCSICGISAPLHPKGCLLKKDEQGKYLSVSGRPLDWHRSEDGEAIFACSNCGHPIPESSRKSAYFQCVQTGVKLRNLLDSLPVGIPKKRIKAGIILSPLLRIRQTNLAQEIIEEGLTKLNVDDWQQQSLGEPSITNADSVSLEILKTAIASQFDITRPPDFTLCGVDQGRAEYWLWKCKYYLPEDWQKMPVALVIDQAKRVVEFGGDITKWELKDAIADCDYGIIDNEPEISTAAELAANTCLEIADQQSGLMDAVREGVAREGGFEHKCWKIRNEKFLKAVLVAFLDNRYVLPSEWEKWLGMPTERSPLVHLTAPKYDPSSGKWKRPGNHVDDLYYAAMFCEVAFYIKLIHKQERKGFDLWGDLNG